MPFVGWIVDRIGVARGLTAAVTLWSAAGILTSLARGPLSLVFFRSLLAVGESGAWPSFAKAVAAWVPLKWRTMAMGVCNSRSSMGAIIAPLLVVWITGLYGWQGAFIITGLLGICWVLAFMIFVHYHPQINRKESKTQQLETKMSGWKGLIKYRQTWAIFICRLLADPTWYFYIYSGSLNF